MMRAANPRAPLRMPHDASPRLARPPSLARTALAFAVAYLMVMAALFFVLVAIAPAAGAEAVPEGAPELVGTVAPDNTLFVPWYFSPTGAAFLHDGDELRTDELWFIVFAPTAETDAGQLALKFQWEKPETVTKQVTVDGVVTTQVETVWNVTQTRDHYVTAPRTSTAYTALSLPTMHGERLTILYEGNAEGRSFSTQVLQVTHDTSIAYAKLERPTLESNYLRTVWIGLTLLGAAVAGALVFRKLYKRAGGYAPKLDLVILGTVLAFLAVLFAFLVWPRQREAILIQGFVPVLLVWTVLAGFGMMQIWREPARWHQMKRYHPIVDARNPQVHVWHVDVPARLHDPHPLTDNPRDVPYVDDDWRSWFFRSVFRARTYLRFPDRDWWYEVTNRSTGIEREHLLEQPLPLAECVRCVALGRTGDDVSDRPHLSWDPAPEGAFLSFIPRLRVHRLILREVPLAPKAYDKEVQQVLAGIVTAEACGQERHALEIQVYQLEADVKAARNSQVRAVVDELFLAEESALTGKKLEELRPKQVKEQAPVDPVGAQAPEVITVTVSKPTNGSTPAAGEPEDDDA